jgi:hypothetical protein
MISGLLETHISVTVNRPEVSTVSIGRSRGRRALRVNIVHRINDGRLRGNTQRADTLSISPDLVRSHSRIDFENSVNERYLERKRGPLELIQVAVFLSKRYTPVFLCLLVSS